MHKPAVPASIKRSAVVMAILTNKLGYGADKLPGLIERSNKFYEAALSGDVVAALEDDLDAWSVAVGFSAALGAYAACAGETDTKEQMRHAEDN